MLLGQDRTLISNGQKLGFLKAASDEGGSGKAMMSGSSYNLFRKKEHLMGIEEKEGQPEGRLSCYPWRRLERGGQAERRPV